MCVCRCTDQGSMLHCLCGITADWLCVCYLHPEGVLWTTGQITLISHLRTGSAYSYLRANPTPAQSFLLLAPVALAVPFLNQRKRRILAVLLTYLARSANLPEGLYILPMFFLYFFIFYFFNGRLSSQRSWDTNRAIFTKISGLVDRCKCLLTSLSFFDFSRDVAMATSQSQKIGILPGPIYFVAMPFWNGMG